MLIRLPDDTAIHQLEYLANKINCDLVLGDDGRPTFERRVIPNNVLTLPVSRKPRKLINHTRPSGPGAA